MTSNQAIGGYLPLELPNPKGRSRFAGAHRFQSARAALAAFLSVQKPSAIWIPHWVCGAVVDAAMHAKVPARRYALGDRLEVPEDLDLGRGELLLYPNYFGVMGSAAARLVRRFGADRVLLDHAQALFSPIPKGCTAILSPRKFVGIPDGGLLVTSRAMRGTYETDTTSVLRARHLLARLDAGPEAGYPLFQAAEATLQDCTPRRMSMLSSRMLDSVDLGAVKQRRNRNVRRLHAVLGPHNEWPLGHGLEAGPLCYPFLARKVVDKRALAQAGLFVPTYWPEVKDQLPPLEKTLYERLLPLPIDQGTNINDAYLDKLAKARILP